MTSPISANAGRSRILLWTARACIAVAWIAEIKAATLGPVPWPGWVMLVAVTGMLASNSIRPVRPRVVLIVAMAILSIVSVIGTLAARAH